MITMQR